MKARSTPRWASGPASGSGGTATSCGATTSSRGTSLGGIPRRELASGINANVNAMARVGLLMLREGAWGNSQLLSNAIVKKAHTVPDEVKTLANPVPGYHPARPPTTGCSGGPTPTA